MANTMNYSSKDNVLVLSCILLVLTLAFMYFVETDFRSASSSGSITLQIFAKQEITSMAITGAPIVDMTGRASAGLSLVITAESTGTYPNLTQQIPNLTFSEDSAYSINLSLYFTNPQNNGLNFSYTAIGNISIYIDNVSGWANLTLDKDFYGVRYVTFTAYNHVFSTDSNNVTINVTSVPDITMNNFNGATTPLNTYTAAQLRNMANVILENTTYGKIEFQESIRIERDLNLDDEVTITQNTIALSPVSLSEFDKNARLSFYNIAFTDPQVLIDGSVCSAACSEVSYIGSTYIVNITEWGSITVRETPITPVITPAASGGGGGSGGSGGGAGGYKQTEKPEFGLDKNNILVTLEQGKNARDSVTVTNLGNSFLNFVLNTTSLDKFVALNEYGFILKPNQTKIIYVNFFIPENAEAMNYQDKLLFTAKRQTESVDVVLIVKPKVSQGKALEEALGVLPLMELPSLIIDPKIILIILSIIIVLILIMYISMKKGTYK